MNTCTRSTPKKKLEKTIRSRRKLSKKPIVQMEFLLDFTPKKSGAATTEVAVVSKKSNRPKWGHINTHKLLNVDDERQLVAAYQNGDMEAGGVIVLAHQGLITSMAQRNAHLGCPLEDLIAEANIGMCEAAGKFDPTKGTRLSTYAVWWIRQYLRKALTENCRIIRIPTCQQQAVKIIHATANRLTEIAGHYPSDEEIAEECGMTALKVQHLRNLTVPMLSLQTPIGSESGDNRTYEDILSDQSGAAESPLDSLSRKNTSASLMAIINQRLNPKERMVVMNRFGIPGGDPQTLEEVGDKMKLTRERIRQIQENALAKIKRALVADKRDDYEFMPVFS